MVDSGADRGKNRDSVQTFSLPGRMEGYLRPDQRDDFQGNLFLFVVAFIRIVSEYPDVLYFRTNDGPACFCDDLYTLPGHFFRDEKRTALDKKGSALYGGADLRRLCDRFGVFSGDFSLTETIL